MRMRSARSNPVTPRHSLNHTHHHAPPYSSHLTFIYIYNSEGLFYIYHTWYRSDEFLVEGFLILNIIPFFYRLAVLESIFLKHLLK